VTVAQERNGDRAVETIQRFNRFGMPMTASVVDDGSQVNSPLRGFTVKASGDEKSAVTLGNRAFMVRVEMLPQEFHCHSQRHRYMSLRRAVLVSGRGP